MKNINLLPKLRQKELYHEWVLHYLFSIIWISFFSFVLVILFQLVAKVSLQNKLKAVQRNIEQLKTQVNQEENTVIRTRIKNANDLIADYSNIAKSSPKWSKMLEAFSVLPPKGVHISSFVMNSNNKMATISGSGDTREEVLELYYAIKADEEHFYNVDFPLQHLLKPSNVSFQFIFYVKDELLK